MTYRVVRAQMDIDRSLTELAIQLCNMLAFAKECAELKKIEGKNDVIREVGQLVVQGAVLIDECMEHGLLGRTVYTSFLDVKTRMQECQTKLANLRGDLSLTLQIRTYQKVENMETSRNFEILKELPRVEAGYDRAYRCLSGTRQEVIDNVLRWATDLTPGQPRIFWLYGLGGEGKTAIAHSVASALDDNGILGGSFFFSRDIAERRRSDWVFSTLAFQLSNRHPMLAQAVSEEFGRNREVFHSAANQFHILFRKPLASVQQQLDPNSPLVFVLDGLDECTTDEGQRDRLLALISQIGDLPSMCRFILTCRPEPDIKGSLTTLSLVHAFPLGQHSTLTIDKDITNFFTRSFNKLVTRYPASCTMGWPGLEKLLALVKRAAGLFIWAVTAVRFIEDPVADDPVEQLNLLLHDMPPPSIPGSSPSPSILLDGLYLQVLRQAYPAYIPMKRLAVIGAIVTSRSPLPPAVLGALLGMGSLDKPKRLHDMVYEAIAKLQSVIYIPEWEKGPLQPLRIIHPSFVDFIVNPDRCVDRQFVIHEPTYHLMLAKQCLQHMHETLRTNVCRLEDSYRLNTEVPDLADRLDKYLPRHVRYACQFWAEHVFRAAEDESDVLFAPVRAFISENLLNWVEALSLLGRLESSRSSLLLIEQWLQKPGRSPKHESLVQIVQDAQRFVQEFRSPIRQSALHVHISAMAFTPFEAPLREMFKTRYPQTVDILTGNTHYWTACCAVYEGHKNNVRAVAYHPDGTQIATASWDRTVIIWDTRTGATVGQPLTGHTSNVNAVLYSPDGSKIATCSPDKTIRIWNSKTGAQIGEPMTGHTHWIQEIAYSPTGTFIASGSADNSVRMWSPFTGTAIGKPMLGHTDMVTTVSVSPDGLFIVSGSEDHSVRIWNSNTNEQVGDPMIGHSLRVVTVAWSPRGSQILSGGVDSVICLWNPATRTQIREPLVGHDDRVITAAYSTDGSRIVSGSYDRTVRLWDALTGAALTPSLTGHLAWVGGVAFSPDGRQFASASSDKTLRIWDTAAAISVGDQKSAHSKWVTAVAISPDGSHIVSASEDNTIMLWDMSKAHSTEASDGTPLIGHTERVTSLAFSPDGTQIVSGSADKTLRIWSTKTASSVSEPLEGHTAWVELVVWSPDGQTIVSGSWDCTLRRWDAKTGASKGEPLTGHKDWIISAAISPNSAQLATGSGDKSIILWDLHTGAAVGEPILGHTDWVTAVAYTPDGSRVVSGSKDKSVRVWSAATGEAVGQPMNGHKDTVTSVEFSSDGLYITSASRDMIVKVWDTRVADVLSRESHVALCEKWLASEKSTDTPFPWFMGNNEGWIMGPGQRRLWYMPAANRGDKFAIHGTRLVIGGGSGVVTILDALPILQSIYLPPLPLYKA
ncbi:WD40 repeat-like protein [Artomyces pyxidatus]|uniref:WD40 repeat-like protein n=1 Tax=Artomyces pyxidatus TaxID=48021 RepID=A0ACB8SY26_9AGAM|nr:WD40 repeat-like protein [Artomyces pyxidatus]